MRGYVQCEVFSFPPFGRHHGRWGNFGPRGAYKETMFGCGSFGNGSGRRGPPGLHGPPGHHTHFGPHGTPGHGPHGPDHHHAMNSTDRCGRGPFGHQGPFGIPGHGHNGPEHHSPRGSPDRCGCRSPGQTGHHKHAPRGHDHHRQHRVQNHSPESSPDRCGRRSPGHPGFYGPHGPHETSNKGPGLQENHKHACQGRFPRHRRHGRCRQECQGYDRPKPGCCKPYKRPGKCCDRSTSDSDKSGNETCDRETLTENPKGSAVVFGRLVLEKAPRCYSV